MNVRLILALMLPAMCVSTLIQAQTDKKPEHKFQKRIQLDDDETSRFALQVQGGRIMFAPGYGLESFAHFQQSYNTAHTSQITTPMGNLKPAGGWYWGGGFHFIFKNMYYGISVTRYNMEATTSAVLKNGDVREMRMVMKPITTDFSLLVGIGKRVKAGMAVGYEDQHCVLYSGYRYNGGNRVSYGTDQALNGIFHGTEDFGITLGVRADVAIIRQARLSLRVDYVGAFAGKQKDGVSDYELDPWKDLMYTSSGSGGIHMDGFNHLYLPENTTKANDDNVYFVGQGACVARLYRGWRFSLGFEIDLWAPRTN